MMNDSGDEKSRVKINNEEMKNPKSPPKATTHDFLSIITNFLIK